MAVRSKYAVHVDVVVFFATLYQLEHCQSLAISVERTPSQVLLRDKSPEMFELTWRSAANTAAYAWLIWFAYQRITFYFFPRNERLSRYQRQPRAYALVTGASGGIGLGYAQELLARGFGVVLHANNREKLAAMADKLRAENPGAAVETISLDARKSNNEDFAAAFKPVIDLPITVVINNVGAITLRPPFVATINYTAEDVDDMINVNARFQAQVSRIMLPVLARNGPSLMLHMSSGAHIGMPWMGMYSGTKAFNIALSTSINRECHAEGVKVSSIAVILGDVHSEGNTIAVSAFSPTSRQFAKTVLDRVELAVDRNLNVICPYWLHALQSTFLEALHETLIRSGVASAIKTKREAWAKTQ